MGKIAAKAINFSLSSVALEDELSSISLDVTQEVIKVDGLSSVGPEAVVGNYDWKIQGEGSADFAASQGDATLFALIGDADGGVTAFDPTGNSAAAGDPNYDGSAALESYSIKGGVGAAVTYSFSLQGRSALARAVA